MSDLRLYGETGSMRKRGPQKKRVETPCHACFRPVYPSAEYCPSCEASGAADRHRASLPPAAPSRRATATNPPAVVRVEGGAPFGPASAAVPAGQRREPRQHPEPGSGVVESGVQTTTGPEAASEPVIPATETPPGGIS